MTGTKRYTEEAGASAPAPRGTAHPQGEDWLTQVLVDGAWLDYARSTEAQARAFFRSAQVTSEPGKWRCVDWIRKSTILIPSIETDPELADHLSNYGQGTIACRGCGQQTTGIVYCDGCEEFLNRTACHDYSCQCPMPGDTVHLHDSATRIVARCGAVDRPNPNHPRVERKGKDGKPLPPLSVDQIVAGAHPLKVCADCLATVAQ